jgi:hypothetical protein
MNTEHGPTPELPADPIAATLEEDLVLYHYRDGLPPERIEAIAAALQASPELRARYAELTALLQGADGVPVQDPPADLERRLWRRLEQRWEAEQLQAAAAPRQRGGRRPRAQSRPWAMAAALLMALGVGALVGVRVLGPGQAPLAAAPPPATTPLPGDDALAARLLEAYVAEHLRASQGLLLTALNAEDSSLAAEGPVLAASLVASNRLYAAAATRAGNTRLAALLQQLEPLLIELANPPPAEGIEVRKGLQQYLRDSDLLFRLRATEARLGPHGGRQA